MRLGLLKVLNVIYFYYLFLSTHRGMKNHLGTRINWNNTKGREKCFIILLARLQREVARYSASNAVAAVLLPLKIVTTPKSHA